MSVMDDYLNKLGEPERAALERVRRIVKTVVPGAEEVITYAMPGFKYKGKYLIAFAPFKDHLSVFPGSSAPEALKDKLGGFKQSKGTIQFTLDNPLPEEIIKELVAIRVAEIG